MMNSPVKFTWRTITDESWSFFFLIKAVFFKKEASIQNSCKFEPFVFQYDTCARTLLTIKKYIGQTFKYICLIIPY